MCKHCTTVKLEYIGHGIKPLQIQILCVLSTIYMCILAL